MVPGIVPVSSVGVQGEHLWEDHRTSLQLRILCESLERQGLRELCQDPGCKKMLVCEVELPRQPGGEAQGEQV